MTATTTDNTSGAVLDFADVDVRFSTEFGSVHAVKGVSLHVNPGEVVALVGESGSGKSVTSMTAMRLLPSNARIGGEITVNGHAIRSISEGAMRRLRGNDIAMVFQEPMTALNPVLTIGTQMTEALELHGIASGRAALERAIELLDMVGIPEPERRVKQYPHELSGGQRQRVVIAIAISCDPKVIIADEPTTALDVTVQADILDLLRSLKDKLNTGILLITHNMGVVADMADRVCVMFKGELVETGTADEVLLNPQHDYTKMLLGSVPRLGAGRDQMGINIADVEVEEGPPRSGTCRQSEHLGRARVHRQQVEGAGVVDDHGLRMSPEEGLRGSARAVASLLHRSRSGPPPGTRDRRPPQATTRSTPDDNCMSIA